MLTDIHPADITQINFRLVVVNHQMDRLIFRPRIVSRSGLSINHADNSELTQIEFADRNHRNFEQLDHLAVFPAADHTTVGQHGVLTCFHQEKVPESNGCRNRIRIGIIMVTIRTFHVPESIRSFQQLHLHPVKDEDKSAALLPFPHILHAINLLQVH